MVVAIVDDSVNIAIVWATISRISRYKSCVFRHLKPTTVDCVHVDCSDNLSAASAYVYQDNLEDVAFSIRLPNQDFTILASPNYLSDQSILVRVVLFDLDPKYFIFSNVIKSQINDWIGSAGLRILDLSDFGIILFTRCWFLPARSRDKILNGILRYLGFVGAKKCYIVTALRPPSCTIILEDFLLVDPVRHAIEIL